VNHEVAKKTTCNSEAIGATKHIVTKHIVAMKHNEQQQSMMNGSEVGGATKHDE
jgi:hypothetical protein